MPQPDSPSIVSPVTAEPDRSHTHAPAAAAPRTLLARRTWMTPTALLLFTAAAVGLLINVWRAPLTHIDGTQDALQSIWFLSWPPYALLHHHNPLYSNYMNYPVGINLLWNTSVIGPSILVWPITAIWNAVLSYNLLMTASMALSAFFAYLAIRRYVRAPLAALAGGAVYGFSPYVMAHVTGHLHSVISAVTAPLLLILLDELYVRQRLRPWLLGVLLAVLGVFQFFTHEENFVTEVGAAVLVTLLLAATFPGQIRGRARYVGLTLLVAVPLTAAVLAYPVHFQLFGPEKVSGTIHDPNVFATDPLNLVVPDYLQFFAPAGAQSLSNQFTGNASEWNGYLGIPLVLIVLVALVRFWRVPVVRIAGLTGIVITVLSFGPHLHWAGHITSIPLPWALVANLPLLRDVLPARLMVFTFLAAGVVLAYVLVRLAAAFRGSALVALAAGVLALLPLVPAFPLRSLPVTAPAFFTTSAADVIPQGAVVLDIPWPSPLNVQRMDALVWAAESHMRFRVLGGYFLNRPSPGQEQLHSLVDELASATPPASVDASQLMAMLGQNMVNAVILEQADARRGSFRLLSDVFGGPTAVVDADAVWIISTHVPSP